MTALYNEIDPYCTRWLGNLIAAGHIAPGVVDGRSITDLDPADVAGPGQRHFFAGIAGWSLALRLAGVPDDADVWTGSCPCQPLSDAGRRRGFDDERHLWPAWFRLIRECRPPVVFGEQVASGLGLAWLDLVFADLEGSGYACAAADLCAAGVGAPHIRQRLFFVAHADGEPRGLHVPRGEARRTDAQAERCGEASQLVHAYGDRLGPWRPGQTMRDRPEQPAGLRASCILADTGGAGLEIVGEQQARRELSAVERSGQVDWRDCDWIPCSDGVARPVEPGTHPLVAGVSDSLERMRAIEVAGWKEVIVYAERSQRNPDEVLRMVREAVHASARRQSAEPGMREQLHASEVLLSFLLCIEAAHARSEDRSSVEKARAEALRNIMRSVRSNGRSGCPPHQWRSDEQRAGEPADTLQSLSFVLARHAEAHRAAASVAYAASDRVGRLRAYGNAIVPQVAAAFIRAAMEAA